MAVAVKRILNKRQLAKLLLILALCCFFYIFSYDYGRSSLAPELKSLKAELSRQKDELFRLRREMGQLREHLSALPFTAGGPDRSRPPTAGQRLLNLRADASETLFDHQLSLVLLEHSQLDREAVIQFNFLQESRVITRKIPLGGAFRFELAGREKLLILEELKPGSVVVKIINV